MAGPHPAVCCTHTQYDISRENDELKAQNAGLRDRLAALDRDRERVRTSRRRDRQSRTTDRLVAGQPTDPAAGHKAAPEHPPQYDKANEEWAAQMAAIERLLREHHAKEEIEAARVFGNWMRPTEVACLRTMAGTAGGTMPVGTFVRLMEEFRVLDHDCKGHVKTTDVQTLIDTPAATAATAAADPADPAAHTAAAAMRHEAESSRIDLLLPSPRPRPRTSSEAIAAGAGTAEERALARKILEQLLASEAGEAGEFDFVRFCTTVAEHEYGRGHLSFRDLVWRALEAKRDRPAERTGAVVGAASPTARSGGGRSKVGCAVM